LLKAWGFVAEAVYDGKRALAVAHARHPDCVLSDIGMPGINGYELATAMRRDETLRGTLIIAISAYADKCKATAAGFDDYLTKPADPYKIKHMLGRRTRGRSG
jgi:CheY-like chemotaxis protein